MTSKVAMALPDDELRQLAGPRPLTVHARFECAGGGLPVKAIDNILKQVHMLRISRVKLVEAAVALSRTYAEPEGRRPSSRPPRCGSRACRRRPALLEIGDP